MNASVNNKSGLTEFERNKGGKDYIKEGPSYEYAKHIKKIDKFYNQYWDAVRDFSDLLHDKGLKKQGDMFFRSYMKQVKKWQDFFVRQVRKLL